ncbi:MAG: GNAT family N-acetyltransferase [Planctomycetes bacterium]|jgi:GNAT superfamily N-acetyltransferase|nr:GNAT family N-acetyltransferase [Planctomycetota bacterium]MCL4730582.1 GNAT family N-acetyltransferase [Planctomycetota bacterium]
MHIRPAQVTDLESLGALCAVLGYPVPAPELAARLAELAGRSDHALLVAEQAGLVTGFADLAVRRTLIGPPVAELEALVVHESARGRGVGAALLAAAEDWARGRGLAGVKLGSRVSRVEAHRFYERHGYTRVKEQAIYRKLWT